jgi:hypothetical protein
MTATDPPAPEPPPLDITLEEWIAATQSCGGIDPPADDPDSASDS